MIGLQEVRVLLIDDSLKRAIPVIKAFAKKGIPLAYFDGNISDLPVVGEKLKGVRLAISSIWIWVEQVIRLKTRFPP